MPDKKQQPRMRPATMAERVKDGLSTLWDTAQLQPVVRVAGMVGDVMDEGMRGNMGREDIVMPDGRVIPAEGQQVGIMVNGRGTGRQKLLSEGASPTVRVEVLDAPGSRLSRQRLKDIAQKAVKRWGLEQGALNAEENYITTLSPTALQEEVALARRTGVGNNDIPLARLEREVAYRQTHKWRPGDRYNSMGMSSADAKDITPRVKTR